MSTKSTGGEGKALSREMEAVLLEEAIDFEAAKIASKLQPRKQPTEPFYQGYMAALRFFTPKVKALESRLLLEEAKVESRDNLISELDSKLPESEK